MNCRNLEDTFSLVHMSYLLTWQITTSTQRQQTENKIVPLPITEETNQKETMIENLLFGDQLKRLSNWSKKHKGTQKHSGNSPSQAKPREIPWRIS